MRVCRCVYVCVCVCVCVRVDMFDHWAALHMISTNTLKVMEIGMESARNAPNARPVGAVEVVVCRYSSDLNNVHTCAVGVAHAQR